MTYFKVGGLALAGLLVWLFFSWATSQIRRGYEADQLQSQLDAKAAVEAADAKAYQEGLNDGELSAKVVEKIKVVFKKVPVHVKDGDACSVSPDSLRLRNEARDRGYREAVPTAGQPDADAGAPPADLRPSPTQP